MLEVKNKARSNTYTILMTMAFLLFFLPIIYLLWKVEPVEEALDPENVAVELK